MSAPATATGRPVSAPSSPSLPPYAVHCEASPSRDSAPGTRTVTSSRASPAAAAAPLCTTTRTATMRQVASPGAATSTRWGVPSRTTSGAIAATRSPRSPSSTTVTCAGTASPSSPSPPVTSIGTPAPRTTSPADASRGRTGSVRVDQVSVPPSRPRTRSSARRVSTATRVTAPGREPSPISRCVAAAVVAPPSPAAVTLAPWSGVPSTGTRTSVPTAAAAWSRCDASHVAWNTTAKVRDAAASATRNTPEAARPRATCHPASGTARPRARPAATSAPCTSGENTRNDTAAAATRASAGARTSTGRDRPGRTGGRGAAGRRARRAPRGARRPPSVRPRPRRRAAPTRRAGGADREHDADGGEREGACCHARDDQHPRVRGHPGRAASPSAQACASGPVRVSTR